MLPSLSLPPSGSQLTILAEQVKRRSILDKSVLEGTLMKATKICGTRKMQKGSFCSKQFCLVQVEWSHQISFKAGITSGIIPTPSLYSNESEAQRLNDLVQGHTIGSKAVARTLVSKLPGQISFYYIILTLGGLKKKWKVWRVTFFHKLNRLSRARHIWTVKDY